MLAGVDDRDQLREKLMTRHLRSPYWNHSPYCKLRIAADGTVGIECEHGQDCCPVCDACTCPAGQSSTKGRRK